MYIRNALDAVVMQCHITSWIEDGGDRDDGDGIIRLLDLKEACEARNRVMSEADGHSAWVTGLY